MHRLDGVHIRLGRSKAVSVKDSPPEGERRDLAVCNPQSHAATPGPVRNQNPDVSSATTAPNADAGSASVTGRPATISGSTTPIVSAANAARATSGVPAWRRPRHSSSRDCPAGDAGGPRNDERDAGRPRSVPRNGRLV
uniref:Uncharacterized protein n=1 Tax=Rhodococcus sp. T104 TaxID=230533 RepID=B6VJL7_9NOCA|nr:hypothetical protein [Rhodococcus sp. T104]